MKTIICLGHAALDRIYNVLQMPVGSTKIRATGYNEVGGGMASNGACAIARLRDPDAFSVEFWGRTGDDSAGRIIREDLARYGVDVTHLRAFEGCMSSQSAVMVDPAGERMIVNYRGDVPADDIGWLPFERIAGAAAILTDIRWLEGARRLLLAACDAKVPAVLDADLGDVPIVRELVPLTEHAIFSEPGLANWAGHGNTETALRDAAEAGARVAGVTRGGNGTLLWFDGGMHHVPAVPVDVVDTLGAGDVFHGAYTLGLAEGMTVLDAARFASAAAAIKCARHGGRSGAPTRGEVEIMIAGSE
jgi:sulfofructose kinase